MDTSSHGTNPLAGLIHLATAILDRRFPPGEVGIVGRHQPINRTLTRLAVIVVMAGPGPGLLAVGQDRRAASIALRSFSVSIPCAAIAA